MPGQHGWPRGWRQVPLPFFQKERQEKKSKWCPATPCPPGKEGRWACRKKTGLHWRRGSAVSHPSRGAQRDVGSPPMPKKPCSISREAAGRYHLGPGLFPGLLVLDAGSSSSSCWEVAGDTLGLPSGACLSQLGKGHTKHGT